MKSKKNQPYQSSLSSKVNLLLGVNEVGSTNNTPRASININWIVLPEYQPRQYFDEEKLNSLAESIAKHGVIEPVIVRQIAPQKFELVAGGRRYFASKQANRTEIPIINLALNDSEAQEIALIENLNREDLNPIEETEGILRLLSIHLQQDKTEIVSLLYKIRNQSQKNLSRNVSPNSQILEIERIFQPLSMSWKSFVETRLPLLKLPEEILSALKNGKIEYTKAIAIAKVKEEIERKQLLELAIEEKLSLSQIKAKLKSIPSSNPAPREEIQQRWLDASKKLKSSKTWSKLDGDRTKQKKLERILSQLEKILEDLE